MDGPYSLYGSASTRSFLITYLPSLKPRFHGELQKSIPKVRTSGHVKLRATVRNQGLYQP